MNTWIYVLSFLYGGTICSVITYIILQSHHEKIMRKIREDVEEVLRSHGKEQTIQRGDCSKTAQPKV